MKLIYVKMQDVETVSHPMDLVQHGHVIRDRIADGGGQAQSRGTARLQPGLGF